MGIQTFTTVEGSHGAHPGRVVCPAVGTCLNTGPVGQGIDSFCRKVESVVTVLEALEDAGPVACGVSVVWCWTVVHA